MGWRNESVDALERLEEATQLLRRELTGPYPPEALVVAMYAMGAAREAFEAAGPALNDDRALFDELATTVADAFQQTLGLLELLQARWEGRPAHLAVALTELAKKRGVDVVGAGNLGAVAGAPAGKHVVTVSRQPEGVQLHLAPEVCAVDVQDGRILVCWPPESARLVAEKLLEKSELPPPAKEATH